MLSEEEKPQVSYASLRSRRCTALLTLFAAALPYFAMNSLLRIHPPQLPQGIFSNTN